MPKIGNKIPLILSLTGIFFFTECRHQYPTYNSTPEVRAQAKKRLQEDQPIITVWIHGTHFIYNTLTKKPFSADYPLQPASALPKKSRSLQDITRAITHFYPNRSSDLIYFYAWSGILSAAERENAACILHGELTTVLDAYEKKHGIRPKIRLITHSHGGNVALNLAKVNMNNGGLSTLVIEELILLACPVQASTMCYTVHPTFQKVYSFYSGLDFIQIIAPQVCRSRNQYCYIDKKHWHVETNPPFSGRYFAPAPHLFNIKMKINGRALLHSEFMRYPFLSVIPDIIACLDTEDAAMMTHRSCVTISYNKKSHWITVYTIPH